MWAPMGRRKITKVELQRGEERGEWNSRKK